MRRPCQKSGSIHLRSAEHPCHRQRPVPWVATALRETNYATASYSLAETLVAIGSYLGCIRGCAIGYVRAFTSQN